MKYIVVLGLLLLPFQAGAVMQTLNAQAGQNQTFANDTNVTISSASNVHTVGWTGVLQPSRGGTGTSTVMTQGSLLFAGASGVYSQDNSNLFWDDTNNRLGIGTINPQYELDITGSARITNDVLISSGGNLKLRSTGQPGNVQFEDPNGNNIGQISFEYVSDEPDRFVMGVDGQDDIVIKYSNDFVGIGTADPQTKLDVFGDIHFTGNMLFTANGSGAVIIGSTVPESTGSGYDFLIGTSDAVVDGEGGDFEIEAGNAAGDEPEDNNRGGDVVLQLGAGVNNGKDGVLRVVGRSTSASATIYLGISSNQPGCIVIGDSDGSGFTYIIANDGVLSSSSTRPSECENE